MTGSVCPWRGQEAFPLTAPGPMETPISILLNSLSDALNHCPDPPAMRVWAGKQIASRRLELFSGDLRLQEPAAG